MIAPARKLPDLEITDDDVTVPQDAIEAIAAELQRIDTGKVHDHEQQGA